MTKKTNQSSIPNHISIIMDGNRRWAKRQGLKIFVGHQKVAREGIEKLADHCIAKGIKYLTLWAFSTENWNRDDKEVKVIMHLFQEAFATSAQRLHKKGVKIKVIGDMSRFADEIQKNTQHWLQETAKNTKLTVTFALNYGGRDEIVRAVNKVIKDVLARKRQVFKKKTPITINEKIFASYLDTAQLPDPDMIIRPGGEKRMSGFLPWQSVYSEYYFTDVLMPDFDEKQLDKALEEFARRQRRFGR